MKRAEQLVQQVAPRLTELRKSMPEVVEDVNINADKDTSGYVALAVATESETKKKDLDTGMGTDREKNMLAFAVSALEFVKEVINGQAKL